MQISHHKIHKHLTRVLHPNRTFIWAIVLLVLSGVALSSYIYISSFGDDFNSVFPSSKVNKVFINQAQGYLCVYPGGWQLEKDQAGKITTFEDPANTSESITVQATTTGLTGVIKRALNIKSEFDFKKGDLFISMIKSGAPGNSGIDVALIAAPDNRLYYISGNSPEFQNFVLNLKPF